MLSILVLEDDANIREIYELMLSGDYAIHAVASLAELKSYMETATASPDLLLADMSLPDGMFVNFLQNERLAKQLQDWPILVVSSIDDMTMIERMMMMRDIDYITKPFNRNELLVKCRRLAQRARRPELFLNPSTLRLSRNNQESEPLTAVESKIVTVLLSVGTNGISRMALTRAIWDEDKQSKKLDVHMTRIRKKIRSLNLRVNFREPDLYALENATTSVTVSYDEKDEEE